VVALENFEDLRNYPRPRGSNSAMKPFTHTKKVLLCAIAVLSLAVPANAAATCGRGSGQVAAVDYGAGPQIELLQANGRGRVIYRGLKTEEATIGGLAFSCSGAQLAFSEGGGNPSPALIVLGIASGKARAVPTERLTASHPTFTRSGRIIFSGGRTGAGREGGTYEVRPDGSGLHRLFGRRELAATAAGDAFVATDPKGNLRSLFLLDRKGRVTHRIAGPTAAGVEDLDPTFSPDGRLIAYTEQREAGRQFHRTIWVVRRDGSHRRRLTFGSESAGEPSFSPDGRRVVFTASSSSAGGALYTLPLAAPHKTRKLSLSSGFLAPAWSGR